MEIRRYNSEDINEIADLFYNTVHSVNIKDYSKKQVDVWATGELDYKEWNRSLEEHYSLVTIEDGIIVGFGDIDDTGYLDRLYIHKDYQGKGIATLICNRLEEKFRYISVHASITAKPFFERRGYKVINEQEVQRKGIKLKNYVMEKQK